MAEILFERVSLIGLGHIGSSLARALRDKQICRHISGCARTRKTRDRAIELAIVDSVSDDPAASVAGADLVVISCIAPYRDESPSTRTITR